MVSLWPLSPTSEAPIAEALEPRLYLDPELIEVEQERIFERTWQLIGHVSELPRPGSYTTGFAGSQPVLVVRDERERATRVPQRVPSPRLVPAERVGPVQGSDPLPLPRLDLQVRRHADRRARGARSSATRLDKSALGLMPARVEELSGLVFVNLDPAATPLADLVGDLPARLERYRIPTLESFAPSGGTQPANWKVVAENYLEGYHIPIAHPGLMRMLDYKHYDTELHEHYAWIEAPLRDKPSSNRLERLYAQLVTPMPGLSEEDRAHVALRVHLSEHDDRSVSRPGQHVADEPRRRWPHPRRVRRLPRAG